MNRPPEWGHYVLNCSNLYLYIGAYCRNGSLNSSVCAIYRRRIPGGGGRYTGFKWGKIRSSGSDRKNEKSESEEEGSL